MTDSAMTLDAASDQLLAAFARLESAVDGALTKPQGGANRSDDVKQMEESFRQQIGALQDENLQLREENHALYAQLEQLREELDDMQSRNENIAFQIDRQVQQLELMA